MDIAKEQDKDKIEKVNDYYKTFIQSSKNVDLAKLQRDLKNKFDSLRTNSVLPATVRRSASSARAASTPYTASPDCRELQHGF